MLRKIGIFIGIFTCFMLVFGPAARADSVSDALKRIDAIIAEIQNLRAEVASLATSVSQSQGATPTVLGASTSKRLTQDLSYGVTNSDIKLIQKLLATDSTIYPYGVASGFFGPKTQEGIRNLQSRFNLDPVGVIGPATTVLLEAFLAKYPGENFPSDALAKDPRVLGASTSTGVAGQIASVQAELDKLTGNSSTPKPTGSVRIIIADLERGEAEVEIRYINGNEKEFIVSGDTKEEVIKAIVKRSGLSEATVRATLDFDEEEKKSKDADDDDAEDAIDAADRAYDDARGDIADADDDGDDVDWAEDTLDEAEYKLDDAEEAYDDEDWDKAVELAEEAEELADLAEDRIDKKKNSKKGDADEIKKIKVEVTEDEAEVTVKYKEDDDYDFTVDEDKADEIIEEIADELNIDEDDVEDLIDFDYGDVKEINVLVDEDDGDAEVKVEYDTGVIRRFTIDEASENRMIDDIADEIDEDEDDVESWTDFDYS